MSQRLDHQALAPDGMRALGGVWQYVATRSGLPPQLVDLVYLRASQINGCAFCISMHSADLLQSGVPARKLLMLQAWEEAGELFTPREQAALRWTEAVTRIADTAAPEADYRAAAEHFGPKELVDLTLAIGLINTYNRMAISFRRTPGGSQAA